MATKKSKTARKRPTRLQEALAENRELRAELASLRKVIEQLAEQLKSKPTDNPFNPNPGDGGPSSPTNPADWAPEPNSDPSNAPRMPQDLLERAQRFIAARGLANELGRQSAKRYSVHNEPFNQGRYSAYLDTLEAYRQMGTKGRKKPPAPTPWYHITHLPTLEVWKDLQLGEFPNWDADINYNQPTYPEPPPPIDWSVVENALR